MPNPVASQPLPGPPIPPTIGASAAPPPKKAQVPAPPSPQDNSRGGGGTDGGGGDGTGGGGGGGGAGQPGASATQQPVTLGNTYGANGPIALKGGPTQGQFSGLQGSFSDASRLQDAMPFWDSYGIQAASQPGYQPGQTFAGQQVTGQSLQNDPMVAAALNNYNLNVLPGIQDQYNSMGLGRSSAAGNAMAMAQASMLNPLYQQAAQLENSGIERQTQQGQFDASLSQQNLNRLQGATEAELGRRTTSAQQQAQAQQQLFQDMMQAQGQQYGQISQGAQQLFDMGSTAQGYAQSADQSSYQDFLRRQGLSEEAINPFGGVSGLLGSSTSGK